MIRYVFTRGMGVLLVILGTGVITFFLFSFAPGDRALAIANARYGGEGNVDGETIERIRIEEGLHLPAWRQFFNWLWDVLQLDFGHSLVSGSNVLDIFLGDFVYTLPLAALAFAIGLVVSIPLAVISALKPGGVIDKISISIASVGAAIPNYWLGLLLILLFASELNWLPAYGTGSINHIILPALTLGAWVVASLTRLLRSLLLEAQQSAFLEALRLRGVSERELFFRHVFHHSMIPFVTVLGLEFAIVLEGAVVIEVTFARKGIGTLLVHAVASRDYPVVQFLVLFAAVVYIFFNFLVDVSYRLLDPRLRKGMDE